MVVGTLRSGRYKEVWTDSSFTGLLAPLPHESQRAFVYVPCCLGDWRRGGSVLAPPDMVLWEHKLEGRDMSRRGVLGKNHFNFFLLQMTQIEA